ncbi:putative N6-adenosine-methyltransferase MT-A70-like [Pistacia vera]|uniref:putative N6-adenosine-methyltransferase MT-A70-like n=1 Tax=Pistacia vera TaxID=55513 RepID=UPI001263A944|nr:putative N6-adenosine-methyltransferase MT-A70-like [Pistacia vera]
MESETPCAKDDNSVAGIKTLRSQLESRIESQHNTHLDLLSSLRNIVPNIVSSLDLSLNLISNFNHRSFNPTPPLPEIPQLPPKSTNATSLNHNNAKPTTSDDLLRSPERGQETRGGNFVIDESGNPLVVVRAMVAVGLLQRVPFKPIDSSMLLRKLESDSNVALAEKKALRELGGEAGAILAVETALRSIAEENGGVELEELSISGKSRVMVLSIDRIRLLKELPESVQQNQDFFNGNNNSTGNQNQIQSQGGDLYGIQRQEMWDPHMAGMASIYGGGGMMGPRGRGVMGMQRGGRGQKSRTEEDDWNDIQEMLNKKTYKESQRSKTGEELLDLIQRPTAKETAVAAKFKSKGGSQVKEYCSSLTKEDCRVKTGSFAACEKVHFRRIIAPHTDINLGDCSFLDTCRHMKTCKYVHYELDPERDLPPTVMGAGTLPLSKPLKPQRPEYCSEVELGEPQWINCDIRTFRMDILGQFGVIMADPPWDIHMELPYGTMADDEMRNLNVPALQTDGLIFLWVTGRAMELGRECLELWGYKRVEEIIWVKTNQLQRIIRTGRTGHWLNHSKEHCLVGIKGNPEVNRNIDTDVIVAEVRETSRKPDEMYPLLERISPRTRKLELFARMHNTQAGWMSLGNQLEGVRLVDEGLRARFKAAYPDVAVQPVSPPRASPMEIDSNATQTRSPFSVNESRSSVMQFADSEAPEVPYASEERPMAVDADMVN